MTCEGPVPALIADAMLGRLARWLRILGYDTQYTRDIQDNELIRRARQEQRIILTRDRKIVEKKAIRGLSIFINSQEPKDQIKEVLAKLAQKGFLRPEPFTRCPACNGLLEKIERRSLPAMFLNISILNNLRFPDAPSVKGYTGKVLMS